MGAFGNFVSNMQALPLEERRKKAAAMIGVDKEALSQRNLAAVQEAAAGAEKVATEGTDPTTVPVKELRKVANPEAPKKDSAKDTDRQQLLWQSIIGLVPAVLGYAVGGDEGGAIGAQVGMKGIQDVGQHFESEKDRQAAAAKLAAERADKDRDFGLKEQELGIRKNEATRKSAQDEQQGKLINAKIDYYGKKGAAGGGSGIQSQRFENQKKQNVFQGEDKLRDDYLHNSAVQNYQKATEGINKVKELENLKNPNSASDMVLIYSFMKAQDPGSVVREGEYATAVKYAGSMLDNYGIKLERVFGGKDMLTPEQRANLIAAAKATYPAYEKPYKDFAESVRQTAITRGYNPDSILMSYQGGTNAPAPQAKINPSSLSREQKIELLKQMGHK